jgi:hypothetical protein
MAIDKGQAVVDLPEIKKDGKEMVGGFRGEEVIDGHGKH